MTGVEPQLVDAPTRTGADPAAPDVHSASSWRDDKGETSTNVGVMRALGGVILAGLFALTWSFRGTTRDAGDPEQGCSGDTFRSIAGEHIVVELAETV
jgi:hypothetical protein